MNIDTLITKMKRDIELKYVYVMMPIPQLQVLIDGLEALQEYADDEGMRVSDAIAERDGWEREVERLQRELEEKDDALTYAMNQIQIKTDYIRKIEERVKELEIDDPS